MSEKRRNKQQKRKKKKINETKKVENNIGLKFGLPELKQEYVPFQCATACIVAYLANNIQEFAMQMVTDIDDIPLQVGGTDSSLVYANFIANSLYLAADCYFFKNVSFGETNEEEYDVMISFRRYFRYFMDNGPMPNVLFPDTINTLDYKFESKILYIPYQNGNTAEECLSGAIGFNLMTHCYMHPSWVMYVMESEFIKNYYKIVDEQMAKLKEAYSN